MLGVDTLGSSQNYGFAPCGDDKVSHSGMKLFNELVFVVTLENYVSEEGWYLWYACLIYDVSVVTLM